MKSQLSRRRTIGGGWVFVVDEKLTVLCNRNQDGLWVASCRVNGEFFTTSHEVMERAVSDLIEIELERKEGFQQ